MLIYTKVPTFVKKTLQQLKSHFDSQNWYWETSIPYSQEWTCHPDKK